MLRVIKTKLIAKTLKNVFSNEKDVPALPSVIAVQF